MELIEFNQEILEKLKQAGYKYIIHTFPTPEEESRLQCCEVGLVKYIPAFNLEEVEDYEITYQESYRMNMDEVITELERAANGIEGVKFFVPEKYVTL